MAINLMDFTQEHQYLPEIAWENMVCQTDCICISCTKIFLKSNLIVSLNVHQAAVSTREKKRKEKRLYLR